MTTPTHHPRVLARALAILLLAACTSSNGTTNNGALQAAGVAQAICERSAECSPFIAAAYGDTAGCVTVQSQEIARQLSLPGVTVTQSDLDACATAARAKSCAEIFANAALASCKHAGTLADGATCGGNAQCISNGCARADDNATCGKCAARGVAGAKCTSNDECSDGFVCNDDQVCAALRKLGESCASTKCSYGLACSDGKCVTALGENAACTRSNGSDACDLIGKGLFCLQSKCTKVVVAAPGQRCGSLNGGAGVAICAKSAHCTLGDGSTLGTCDAPLAEGDACDDNTDKTCPAPLVCLTGKCAVRDLASCK